MYPQFHPERQLDRPGGGQGETKADADRKRTGRGARDQNQRNGREPDADRTRAVPFPPGRKNAPAASWGMGK
eukprot:gene23602-biopygen22323